MPTYRSRWDTLSDALSMYGQLSQQNKQNQQWEQEYGLREKAFESEDAVNKLDMERLKAEAEIKKQITETGKQIQAINASGWNPDMVAEFMSKALPNGREVKKVSIDPKTGLPTYQMMQKGLDGKLAPVPNAPPWTFKDQADFQAQVVGAAGSPEYHAGLFQSNLKMKETDEEYKRRATEQSAGAGNATALENLRSQNDISKVGVEHGNRMLEIAAGKADYGIKDKEFGAIVNQALKYGISMNKKVDPLTDEEIIDQKGVDTSVTAYINAYKTLKSGLDGTKATGVVEPPPDGTGAPLSREDKIEAQKVAENIHSQLISKGKADDENSIQAIARELRAKPDGGPVADALLELSKGRKKIKGAERKATDVKKAAEALQESLAYPGANDLWGLRVE